MPNEMSVDDILAARKYKRHIRRRVDDVLQDLRDDVVTRLIEDARKEFENLAIAGMIGEVSDAEVRSAVYARLRDYPVLERGDG